VRVPLLAYHVMFYGALALAAIAVLYYRLRPDPAALPQAHIANRGALRRFVLAWLPGVAMVACPIGAFLLYKLSTDVVVVTDGGNGHPTASRYKQIGGVPAITYAPGRTAPDDSVFGPREYTYVDNQSPYDVRIETTEYGRSFGFAPDPVIIPPGTGASELHIDCIGPDNHPPATVEDTVNLGFDSRTWLIWN